MFERYEDFRSALFPGDPAPDGFVGNPFASGSELLADVSKATGIKLSWLRDTGREVLEGMSGLGCLWFLHGAKGEIEVEAKPPEWFAGIQSYIIELVLDDADEQRRKIRSVFPYRLDVVNNWRKGVLPIRKIYEDGKKVIQVVRVGKYIDAYSVSEGLDSKKLHQELKWRNKANRLEWYVSCHPYDVLTMSAGRPWVSCMKPGGLFQFGPLTDMAAGSAILWYRHPGADTPCGRVVLRPFLDNNYHPCIATGGRLYGEGAGANASLLNNILGPFLQDIEVQRVKICPIGRNGRALTRAIYSDVDKLANGCTQTREEYEEAYENLGTADWPASKLDIGEVSEVARLYKEGYEWRESDNEDGGYSDRVLLELIEEGEWLRSWYFDTNPPVESVYDDLYSDNVGSIASSFMQDGINDDIYDYDEVSTSTVRDLVEAVREMLIDYLQGKGSDEVDVYFYLKGNGPKKSSFDLVRYEYGRLAWYGTIEEFIDSAGYNDDQALRLLGSWGLEQDEQGRWFYDRVGDDDYVLENMVIVTKLAEYLRFFGFVDSYHSVEGFLLDNPKNLDFVLDAIAYELQQLGLL